MSGSRNTTYTAHCTLSVRLAPPEGIEKHRIAAYFLLFVRSLSFATSVTSVGQLLSPFSVARDVHLLRHTAGQGQILHNSSYTTHGGSSSNVTCPG